MLAFLSVLFFEAVSFRSRWHFMFCLLSLGLSLVLTRFSRQCCWSWFCARPPSSPSGPDLVLVTRHSSEIKVTVKVKNKTYKVEEKTTKVTKETSR